MRILHITESARGGVGTYLAEILHDQTRRYGEDGVRALLPTRDLSQLTGVDRRLLIGWPRPGRGVAGVLRLAVAVVRAVRAFRPDIVHAHSSVAGGVVRLLYGWSPPPFRIVYCPHGWAFDRRTSPPVRRLTEIIERQLSRQTDRIIAISAHERAEGERIGIAPERFTTVLNGIADAPALRPARWDDERVRALFVGRLDEQKGFDTLLDAVAPIDDRVSLRVIGKAVAGPATAPRHRRTRIDYLGWRSLAEVAVEMAAADVVVVPSRWEGFGLVAVEAMRAGCAVVASAVGGLREIVAEGETGVFIPPDNPGRLMEALMAHDRAGWQAMGRAGRRRYETMFTADRMNAELAQVYRDVTAPAAATGHGLAFA